MLAEFQIFSSGSLAVWNICHLERILQDGLTSWGVPLDLFSDDKKKYQQVNGGITW